MRNDTRISFDYAAASYLNEWMWSDRRFNAQLDYRAIEGITQSAGLECLEEVAKYYGVIRNFKGSGRDRLLTAYQLLCNYEQPTSHETAASMVEMMTERMKGTYGKSLLSAASKFLWMRFKSPIIVYDTLANSWLCRNTKYANDTYENYCKFWRDEYDKQTDAVDRACADLICFKKFTLAGDVEDSILTEWTRSIWFRERVFDNYIVSISQQQEWEKL